MLRIGFFVCLKNSSIIDDFLGGGVRLEKIMNLGSLATNIQSLNSLNSLISLNRHHKIWVSFSIPVVVCCCWRSAFHSSLHFLWQRMATNRRQTESRECLYTLPRCEGGKACEAGLKSKEIFFISIMGVISVIPTAMEISIDKI